MFTATDLFSDFVALLVQWHDDPSSLTWKSGEGSVCTEGRDYGLSMPANMTFGQFANRIVADADLSTPLVFNGKELKRADYLSFLEFIIFEPLIDLEETLWRTYCQAYASIYKDGHNLEKHIFRLWLRIKTAPHLIPDIVDNDIKSKWLGKIPVGWQEMLDDGRLVRAE